MSLWPPISSSISSFRHHWSHRHPPVWPVLCHDTSGLVTLSSHVSQHALGLEGRFLLRIIKGTADVVCRPVIPALQLEWNGEQEQSHDYFSLSFCLFVCLSLSLCLSLCFCQVYAYIRTHMWICICMCIYIKILKKYSRSLCAVQNCVWT